MMQSRDLRDAALSGDPAVSVRGAKLLAQELLQNPERRARAETRAGALADEGRSDA